MEKKKNKEKKKKILKKLLIGGAIVATGYVVFKTVFGGGNKKSEGTGYIPDLRPKNFSQERHQSFKSEKVFSKKRPVPYKKG